MQGLIGRKVGMSRLFDTKTGESIPVTIIQTGTNVVHQIKTVENDGYSAVQLGFDACKETKLTKPELGHVKKHGGVATRIIKEFDIDESDKELAAGQRIGVEIFENTKEVDVVGTSKGRGFAGVIKRYNFRRGRETHGSKNHRTRGSVGSNTFPARVFPGLKMAGHHGNSQVTVKRLSVVSCDKENGVIIVRGAIPGPTNGVVFVKKFK